MSKSQYQYSATTSATIAATASAPLATATAINQTNAVAADENDTAWAGLHALYAPKRDAQLVDTHDIVFIHGVDGHFAKTWSIPGDGDNAACWPRDWLPLDIPTCRTFSYQYATPTSRFSRTVDNGLPQKANTLVSWLGMKHVGEGGRKVIFVAHGVGGIILKLALHQAMLLGAKTSALLPQICGILFLGVPHMGMGKATVASWFMPSATTMVGELAAGSAVLVDAQSHFENVLQHYPAIAVHCFYETRGSTSINVLVVSQKSAQLDCAAVNLGIEASHFKLTQMVMRQGPYTIYMETIRGMMLAM